MPEQTVTKDELERAILESGEPILQYFRFSHLPERLQETSRRFAALACYLAFRQTRSAERTVALRKLLEGKDAAVRAEL